MKMKRGDRCAFENMDDNNLIIVIIFVFFNKMFPNNPSTHESHSHSTPGLHQILQNFMYTSSNRFALENKINILKQQY